MKKIVILYSEYSPLIDAIKYQLSDCFVDCVTSLNNNEIYDLVVLANYNGIFDGDAIACHHSLLPAFDTKTPVKDAVITGVKVTGITVYHTKTKKIIAQYPVFISNSMHYDELKQELTYLEQTIYPLVIKKIINNEPVELSKIMKKSCGTTCGGCTSCSH